MHAWYNQTDTIYMAPFSSHSSTPHRLDSVDVELCAYIRCGEDNRILFTDIQQVVCFPTGDLSRELRPLISMGTCMQCSSHVCVIGSWYKDRTL